ncbi:hypothetical protein [Streptomyces sp. TP-A0356]|uniref:hypothetical protein n=1 Tax=Streptomyces sp. TP-A0356 TaxID=1359208 RepID=UPI000ABCEF9C|nr:hypothetical protein [Streptomyces sp. TP-A0356]
MSDVTPGAGAGRPEPGLDEVESREEEAALRAGETERREAAAGQRPEAGERREAAQERPGEGGLREAGAPRTGAGERAEAAEAPPGGAPHETRLLQRDESDKFALRLQHAVGSFVDSPRESVQEADRVVEEVAARLAAAVAARRRTLKASWQDTGDSGDTEQLRLALRDYRATAERLLNL